MKRILSALFLLFLVCNGNAQEYAIEDIKQNAINLLEHRSSSQRQRSIAPISRNVQSVQPIVRNERPYLYIVEMADSAGWAIMTNEQQYSTYIGYAENGTFSYEEMPPALGILLEQHMDAIDSVRLLRFPPPAPPRVFFAGLPRVSRGSKACPHHPKKVRLLRFTLLPASSFPLAKGLPNSIGQAALFRIGDVCVRLTGSGCATRWGRGCSGGCLHSSRSRGGHSRRSTATHPSGHWAARAQRCAGSQAPARG